MDSVYGFTLQEIAEIKRFMDSKRMSPSQLVEALSKDSSIKLQAENMYLRSLISQIQEISHKSTTLG